MIDAISFIISALFSPYITALVFIIIITYTYAHDLAQFLPWMVTFLFFAIILPGIYVLWQMEAGKIHDFHISNRQERKVPFLILGASSIIGLIILLLLHAARQVVIVGVAYSLNALVIALITQYWKISVHMVLFSSVVTITVILYGANFGWLYLILIPLAWSRIHRKHHTLAQVTAGAILAFVLTTAVFWGFGYL